MQGLEGSKCCRKCDQKKVFIYEERICRGRLQSKGGRRFQSRGSRLKKKWRDVLLLEKECLSFMVAEERVDEEEKVTKSVILKDLLGDYKHLRKNNKSLIS